MFAHSEHFAILPKTFEYSDRSRFGHPQLLIRLRVFSNDFFLVAKGLLNIF